MPRLKYTADEQIGFLDLCNSCYPATDEFLADFSLVREDIVVDFNSHDHKNYELLHYQCLQCNQPLIQKDN